LLHRTILEIDEEFGHGGMRMVLIQDTDKRTPVQEMREMKAAAEDSMGGGAERIGEREE